MDVVSRVESAKVYMNRERCLESEFEIHWDRTARRCNHNRPDIVVTGQSGPWNILVAMDLNV